MKVNRDSENDSPDKLSGLARLVVATGTAVGVAGVTGAGAAAVIVVALLVGAVLIWAMMR